MHFEEIERNIPQVLLPLMTPFFERIHQAFSPGLSLLSWNSLNIEEFLSKVDSELKALELLIKQCSDIISCRVEAVLQDMSLTCLSDIPEDEPVTLEDFIRITEETTREASIYLSE
ncbi:unnamed protein product [Protopolystoma xenopodis]|uniref:Uncharacterized protein n=1 Tax=Protopolystoma xenopodis TaxID=117903 RepID=A0A3S4ZQG3_9PLAT|nr:unnamed protein product [Protopolystoma xenopodis]